MAVDPAPQPLAQVAAALEIDPDDLTEVALDLVGQWLSGRRRFPTLSQQNQEWYRTILSKAGKSNPSRDDLKAWFGLPHGTAQYLAGVFYDPEADRASDETKEAIATSAVTAIGSAIKNGQLGAQEASFYVSPKVATSLETLLSQVLEASPMAPPTVTRLTGTAKVAFSAKQGLEALCLALGGDQGDRVRQAANAGRSGG